MDLNGIFPVIFASEEAYLLSAIGLGFLFGFSLERAGFGNARKLAAQFYLYDLTVFKVMFTAILVASVGFYALVAAGLVDLSRMWINPTYLWSEVVGGFLLGVGFIVSGLCPGTAAVSMASGRWDGLVAMAGIFAGTALFAVALDWVPGLSRLYEAGGQVSVLPALLHLPAPAVLLVVVVVAGAAFVGAEKVERVFRARYGEVELTPARTPRTPRVKFALAGTLAGVALVSIAWKAPGPNTAPIPMTPLEPLDLAEAIIARDPSIVILDLRPASAEPRIPRAQAVTDSSATEVLSSAAPSMEVVVYDEQGTLHAAPASWPRSLAYRYLRGGFAAWKAEVLTPLPASGFDESSRERTERQHQLAAFFSGAKVTSSGAAPPPPAAANPAAGVKKKSRGC